MEFQRPFHAPQRSDVAAGEAPAPDGDAGNWSDTFDGAESGCQRGAVPYLVVRQRSLAVGLLGVAEAVIHDHRRGEAVEPSSAVVEEGEFADFVDQLGRRGELRAVDLAVAEPRAVQVAELMIGSNLEVVGVVGRRVAVDDVELGIALQVGLVVIAPQVGLHRLVEAA